MAYVAQTNLQLYNQLRQQGRDEDELKTIRRAYDLACTVYSGYYQADGKPFVAHSVGVASVVAGLGRSADLIAASLVHNAYGNADFGDGREHVITESRRRTVRQAVGSRVEALVARFHASRLHPEAIRNVGEFVASLDEVGRDLLLIELADHVEKYVDLGILYFGNGEWLTDMVAREGGKLIEIARILGYPDLAVLLQESFDAAAADAGVPHVLREEPDRWYLALLTPLSCRRRAYPALRECLRKTWRRLPPAVRSNAFARKMAYALR